MKYVSGRFLAKAALTAVLAVLGALPTTAAAQEPGVTVDPGSPAGKEYALPIDTARRKGQGDGGAKSRGASPGTSPPFGQGITPGRGSASNGSTSDSGAATNSRERASSDDDAGRGGNDPAASGGSGGGSGSANRGSTANVPSASASAGSTGATALTAGAILAVLAAGGLGGFLVQRKRGEA